MCYASCAKGEELWGWHCWGTGGIEGRPASMHVHTATLNKELAEVQLDWRDRELRQGNSFSLRLKQWHASTRLRGVATCVQLQHVSTLRRPAGVLCIIKGKSPAIVQRWLETKPVSKPSSLRASAPSERNDAGGLVIAAPG